MRNMLIVLAAAATFAGGTAACGGGTAGTGGSAGSGGSPALVNGCSIDTADDHGGQATVDLAWTLPTQECIIVDQGTVVTWTGDFGLHPLSGGETAATDPVSPISTSDQSGASASVTFDTLGDFPYFCEAHGASMQGVVYVVAP